jgi:hypothetical protein
MNNITKKTMLATGGTVAAAALAVVGFAGPASANTTSDLSSEHTSSQTSVDQTSADVFGDISDLIGNVSLSGQSPLVVAPQVGLGDVASGNNVSAPVAAPVASGNDTSVDAPVTAPVTGGVTAPVSGGATDLGAGVSAAVDGLVGDVTGALGLDSVLGR